MLLSNVNNTWITVVIKHEHHVLLGSDAMPIFSTYSSLKLWTHDCVKQPYHCNYLFLTSSFNLIFLSHLNGSYRVRIETKPWWRWMYWAERCRYSSLAINSDAMQPPTFLLRMNEDELMKKIYFIELALKSSLHSFFITHRRRGLANIRQKQ